MTPANTHHKVAPRCDHMLKEPPMLTLAILSLVLIPVAIDLGTRRHRQTIALSMVRPRR